MAFSAKDAEVKPERPSSNTATETSDHSIVNEQPVEKSIDVRGEQNVATNQAKENELEPPPNGGLVAWMQVVGSFFLFFNCWYVNYQTSHIILTYLRGTVNSFGVFQTYYENNPYWVESPSNISWIGSVQAFLLLMVGGKLCLLQRLLSFVADPRSKKSSPVQSTTRVISDL